jgi:hypothetical protein
VLCLLENAIHGLSTAHSQMHASLFLSSGVSPEALESLEEYSAALLGSWLMQPGTP